MKKILIATNILLLITIAFLIYFYSKCSNKRAEDKVNQNCEACESYETIDWTGKIDEKIGKRLADNYKYSKEKNFIWDGGVNTGVEDTKSVWFPLKTIKKYIWEIETNNCRNNCNDSLGVRIYFGKYPETSDPMWDTVGMSEFKVSYANHHTLFMVPTLYDATKDAHFDFNPWVPDCHHLIGTPYSSKDAPRNPLLLGGDAQNHGSLIPPRTRTEEGTAF